MTTDLPPEIILLICQRLCRKDIVRLLTVNWNWFTVVCTLLYSVVVVRTRNELYAYRNLFNETRRQRSLTHDHGFYSRQNYAQFIRTLDLSQYPKKAVVTDSILDDLTKDCINLERLNLYNCHAISTKSLMHILDNCPRIKHLNLAFATNISAKFLLHDRANSIETLNITGTRNFFSTCKSKDLQRIRLSSLRMLECSSNDVLQTIIPLVPIDRLETVIISWAGNDRITDFLTLCTNNLHVLRLKNCYHLTGETLARLPRSLERLEFQACRISAEALSTITVYDRLETLNIKGTNAMSNDDVLQIIRKCSPRLKRFFTGARLTRETIDTLFHRFPNLTHLGLAYSNEIDNHQDLPNLPSSITYLEFFSHFRNVEQLLLKWASPNVRELILIAHLTLNLTELLPARFPNLEILYADSIECQEQGISFVDRMPNLRGVHAPYLPQHEKLRRMEQPFFEWRYHLDFFSGVA